MKKILLLAVCSLMFACMGSKTPKMGEQITVDFKAPEPNLKVEKIVQLETNKEAFYGSFFRVYVTGQYIFVQDGQQILVFDPNGKYHSKVQKLGSGPQEYINLSHFWVLDDEIYVVASEKKGVLVYALSGDYLRTVPLDFQPDAVVVTADYMAFKSAYNPAGTLIATDRQGKKIYETIDPILAKTTVSIPAVWPFTESNGKVFYFPDFSSSIYTVGADTADVREIRFDFGSHSITPEYIANLDQETMMTKLKEDQIVRFPAFYPGRQWWGLTFSMGNLGYCWYYNPTTGKQYITSEEGKRSVKPIVAALGDSFVKTVEATEFLENPYYAPYRAGRTVNENDNAILIFYSIQ